MQPFRPLRGIAQYTLAALIAMAITGQCLAQVSLPPALNLIPTDAHAALVIPSLSGLNQKIARLNEQSLSSSVPKMADVLSMTKMMTGMMAGLDDDGSLIMIISDATAPDNNYLLLLPVSDYQMFISNYGGNPENQITALSMPTGKPSFAKQVANHAVIGPSMDLVSAYQPPADPVALIRQLGNAGRRCVVSSDAMLIFNFPVLQDQITPLIDQMQSEMHAEIEESKLEETNQTAEMIELGASMIDAYFEAARAVVRDSSAAVIGLDFTDHGIGLSSTLQFKPDSYLARMFPNAGGAANRLAKLPNQPYLIATALDYRGTGLTSVVNAWIDQLPDNNSQFITMMKEGVEAWHLINNMAMAYYPPNLDLQNPDMNGGFLNGVAVMEIADGNTAAYMDWYETYLLKLKDMNQIFGIADTPDPTMQFKVEYNQNALQIDGIRVDEFEFHHPNSQQTELTQQLGPAAPMLMNMLGANGSSGYIAAKGPYVLMTTSRNLDTLKLALASVDQNTGLGSDGPIRNAREAGLTPNSAYEAYFSVAGIADTASTFMSVFGMQLPITPPADLPPIASGASIEDHGISSRFFIPAEVIKFGMDTTVTMQTQMAAPMQPHPGPNIGSPDLTDAPQRQGPPRAPF